MLSAGHSLVQAARKPLIGSLGHLVVFVWALGMALVPSGVRGIPAALLALAAVGMLYPFAFRRLARPRWLLILGGIFVVNLLFAGRYEEPDMHLLGYPLAGITLLEAARMVLRAVIILIAAEGFSASVDIVEVAGLLERGGLRGLGFALGVAANLLPELRHSATAAWHTLRMRGGLRGRKAMRGLQLMVLAVLTTSLRRAEEIVLAAEVRAFRPEHSRRASLKVGRADLWMLAAAIFSLAAAALL